MLGLLHISSATSVHLSLVLVVIERDVKAWFRWQGGLYSKVLYGQLRGMYGHQKGVYRNLCLYIKCHSELDKREVLRDLFHKKHNGFNPIYQDRDQKDLEDASFQRLALRVDVGSEFHAGVLTQGYHRYIPRVLQIA